MHKRTIRLAISAIMLALVVSVPVDAAGQRRAEQRQRERAPRASTPRARSAPRRSAPRDSNRRARPAPRRAVPRASTPRARPAPRDSDRRDSFRRGFGQFGFGRRGFRSQFNFNFGLDAPQYYGPQYYPPYSWERMPYNSGCRWWDEPSYSVVYRGGRYVREYFCVNTRNLY